MYVLVLRCTTPSRIADRGPESHQFCSYGECKGKLVRGGIHITVSRFMAIVLCGDVPVVIVINQIIGCSEGIGSHHDQAQGLVFDLSRRHRVQYAQYCDIQHTRPTGSCILLVYKIAGSDSDSDCPERTARAHRVSEHWDVIEPLHLLTIPTLLSTQYQYLTRPFWPDLPLVYNPPSHPATLPNIKRLAMVINTSLSKHDLPLLPLLPSPHPLSPLTAQP
jgi:hypothetical protein